MDMNHFVIAICYVNALTAGHDFGRVVDSEPDVFGEDWVILTVQIQGVLTTAKINSLCRTQKYI